MNQRQACCNLELIQYSFKIEHKLGKLDIIPDILSRDPALTFSSQALNQLNTGTMLLLTAFLSYKVTTSLLGISFLLHRPHFLWAGAS